MQRLVIPERLYGQTTLLRPIEKNEGILTLQNFIIMQKSMEILVIEKESLLSLLPLGRLSSEL